MGDVENKVLLFLESGYKIDIILRELDIDEESLSDIIIELECRELVILEDKNWVTTRKGKDILKNAKEELLKKLKICYLHGDITRDEFQKKRKELESTVTIGKHDTRYKIEDKGFVESAVEDKQNNIEYKIEDKGLVESAVEDKKLTGDKKVNCPKCGKGNKIGSNYCYKCGTSMKLYKEVIV